MSVNVAIGLANLGYRVGLLDTDIYGPSIPKLMHLQDQRPFLTKERKMIPLDNYGVRCMSVGFITKEDSALVWRGMMVQKVLQQLMHATEWNEDILVIDLPPGTGFLYSVIVYF